MRGFQHLFFCSLVFIVLSANVKVIPCSETCTNGGDVSSCCIAHGYLGGECVDNNAWCKEKPGQERPSTARSVHKAPCDETCTNGGDVNGCCKAHGFVRGTCQGNKAFCDEKVSSNHSNSTTNFRRNSEGSGKMLNKIESGLRESGLRDFERFNGILYSEDKLKYKKLLFTDFKPVPPDDWVEARIGSGSQGVVYRATHFSFKEVVAIKIMHDQYLTDPRCKKYAKREIDNITVMQGHKGVVPFLGYVVKKDKPYEIVGYIMKFVETSLENVIFERYSSDSNLIYNYNLSQAIKWMIELASCLASLHRNAVIHRDLNPTNILVDWSEADKPIFICDFGLSKDLDLEEENMTLGVGNRAFIPVEMQQEGSAYRHPVDVYSLGLVFWQLLHRKKNIGGIADWIPLDLAGQIKKCMSIDGKLRPTMRELENNLKQLLAASEQKWDMMMIS